MKYVAIIGKTGNGYGAHLPDLSGCVAAGETFEETRNLIEEAANFQMEKPKDTPSKKPSIKLDLSDFSHLNDEHDWIDTRAVLVGLDCYRAGCKRGPTWACRKCFDCTCNRDKRKSGCNGVEGSKAAQIRETIRRLNGTDLRQKFGVG